MLIEAAKARSFWAGCLDTLYTHNLEQNIVVKFLFEMGQTSIHKHQESEEDHNLILKITKQVSLHPVIKEYKKKTYLMPG